MDASEAGPEDLHDLRDALAQSDRWMARAVALAATASRAGLAETVEGLPIDLVLANRSRQTRRDRNVLSTAADVLADLPGVARLFASGELSWGQVAGITQALARQSKATRAAVDARIAQTAADHDGVDVLDPDALVWAVHDAIEEHRPCGEVDRKVDAGEARNFLAVHTELFSSRGKVYGEFDTTTFAGVVNALDAAAGRLATDSRSVDSESDDRNGDDDSTDTHGSVAVGVGGLTPGRWSPKARARQYAAALADIAAAYLAGDAKAGRRAKPLFVAYVDVADVTTSHAGQVALNVRGLPATLTWTALEQLTSDATLRTVLFDKAMPLAVAERTRQATIPAATTLAVGVRDRGDRLPGSHDPLGWTDVHHVRERRHGGDHHPTNLVSLSRRSHTLVHAHGWQLTVDPDTGMVAMERNGVTIRSLPAGTRLSRTPDQPGAPTHRRSRARPPQQPMLRRDRDGPDPPLAGNGSRASPATSAHGHPTRGDPAGARTAGGDPPGADPPPRPF